MATFKDLPQLENDGLATSEVGAWSEEKYRLVEHYASVFCRSMRRKWGSLVYLDLFAGPGRAKFKGTNRIVAASPMIALGIDDKFDRYIFCEADKANAQALKKRVDRDHPDANVSIVDDDVNNVASNVVDLIPRHSKSSTVLGFCFADPYKMKNLNFNTIETLTKRFMDFLILIPSGMDTHRNERLYVAETNATVSRFLGDDTWRERWILEKANGTTFEKFIVAEYGRSMQRLEYSAPPLADAATVRSDMKNLLLYRLVFYSRHKLGTQFWREAKKYTNPQTGFDDF